MRIYKYSMDWHKYYGPMNLGKLDHHQLEKKYEFVVQVAYTILSCGAVVRQLPSIINY
jgi:hypothetical protein